MKPPVQSLTAIGVVVGQVTGLREHPNADRLRIADVEYGTGAGQIVFGGLLEVVQIGSLVPVAPPTRSCRVQGQKMRRRKYRGVNSYGELCSLYELGLASEDTDQVAVLVAGAAKVGTPIAELIKGIRNYDRLWTVFQRPIGYSVIP